MSSDNGEFDFSAGAPARQPRKTPPVGAPPARPPGDATAPAGADTAATATATAAAAGALALANARRAVGAAAGIAVHVAGLDWQAIADELTAHGYAIVPGMLTADESAAMAAQYAQPQLFRSRVVMARHGFGSGEYQYFRYPLPSMISALRQALYAPLAAIANRWHEAMDIDTRFPAEHADFLARCHAAGQNRPTPLLLQYGAGDYNCLHQDLYGEHVFPLQAAILLSEPGKHFDGGEFVLTEQRPRMQSRVEVVPLRRGDMVIFPVNHRPVQGTRGVYRVAMRHGVSRLRAVAGANTGPLRHTLGIIFHDAT
ncbi:2OG-Fe(II) oxygenase [Oxalobacteraceae bacterium OTU3CAMAD1]|nr:2OG-Fe(II) oxygenase [Oxalobacteraceae bacterium OTU3CAMAD1]